MQLPARKTEGSWRKSLVPWACLSTCHPPPFPLFHCCHQDPKHRCGKPHAPHQSAITEKPPACTAFRCYDLPLLYHVIQPLNTDFVGWETEAGRYAGKRLGQEEILKSTQIPNCGFIYANLLHLTDRWNPGYACINYHRAILWKLCCTGKKRSIQNHTVLDQN